MFKWLVKQISKWLLHEYPPRSVPLCDFDRLTYEIRPGDVLLVEGRSRVSEIIKLVTQSPWSHSMLYIGRLHDIESASLRERVKQFYDGNPNEQLLVEGMLGKGTIVTPLSHYRQDHIRICRPKSISRRDAQMVLSYAIKHLGTEYDIRQLLDLFRLMFPWTLMPRRWLSSLFIEHTTVTTRRMICSTIIAEAFGYVQFPILPALMPNDNQGIKMVQRNPRLITPKDFDYSPYFEIIKYPFIGIDEHVPYRNLPWSADEVSHGDTDTFCPIDLTFSDNDRPFDEITEEVTIKAPEKSTDDKAKEGLIQKIRTSGIFGKEKPTLDKPANTTIFSIDNEKEIHFSDVKLEQTEGEQFQVDAPNKTQNDSDSSPTQKKSLKSKSSRYKLFKQREKSNNETSA